MNLLKHDIVERISKIIELKDMVIVRYNKSPLLTDWIYRVYLRTGGMFVAYSYRELLDSITIHRLFN